MAKSRKPTKASADSEFVVATTSAGMVLGRVLKETATGTVTLRTSDDRLVELSPDDRVAEVADPSLFKPEGFRPNLSGDAALLVDSILTLYKEEAKTADARREWARAQAGAELPEGKSFDELIRFRYEERRFEWASVLRETLRAAIGGGDDRLLLSTLDHMVPTDARRVALEVAIDQRLGSAIPALCAASIHRTQTAFARDAVRALAIVAPERLSLIARHVSREVLASVDAGSYEKLPELGVLAGAETASPLDVDVSPKPSFRPEVALHLLLGRPLGEQVRILAEQDASDESFERVRAEALKTFASIADRESPTAYESVLRAALAGLLLADESRISPEVATAAARAIVRDVTDDELTKAIEVLPEPSAVRAVRAALQQVRAARLATLLGYVADRRPSLAASLRGNLRPIVQAAETESDVRIAGLRLLAAVPDVRELVTRESIRELNREPKESLQTLAASLVENGVELDAARLRRTGLDFVLRSLSRGSPAYAAHFLDTLQARADADTWRDIQDIDFPETWLEESSEWRRTLLAWMPFAHESRTSLARMISSTILYELPSRWNQWPADVRAVAVRNLTGTGSVQSVSALCDIIEHADAGPEVREQVEAGLVVLALRDRAVLRVASDRLSDATMRGILFARAVRIEEDLAAEQSGRSLLDEQAAVEVAARLKHEIERAMNALGHDGPLAVLFTKLLDDLAAYSEASASGDDDVRTYQKKFAGRGNSSELCGPEPLLEALRRTGGRSRASRSSQIFFKGEAQRLLDGMSLEALEAFITEQRRSLDRLDLEAVELVATAFARAHGSASAVVHLLDGAANKQNVINVGLRVREHADPTLTQEIFAAANVTAADMAQAVATRNEKLGDLRAAASADGALVKLGHRLAPTLDAIDGLVLNYMRVRRVLAQHGLLPVEPVLADLRRSEALTTGAHRVIGQTISEGLYEVLTHGLRSSETDVVLAPATVAKADDGNGEAQ